MNAIPDGSPRSSSGHLVAVIQGQSRKKKDVLAEVAFSVSIIEFDNAVCYQQLSWCPRFYSDKPNSYFTTMTFPVRPYVKNCSFFLVKRNA
jgi:hypothetical protein